MSLVVYGILLAVVHSMLTGGNSTVTHKKPIPFGTGWGTRIFRIRWGGSFTLQDVQNWLGQLPPMDHANRFTDGVPVTPSTYIDAINGIIPLMRTKSTDHAVSHRLAWLDNSTQGTNTQQFIDAAFSVYDTVLSQTNPPQKAISIDQAESGIALSTIQQVSTALLGHGYKYIAWGAGANITALNDGNYAMLKTNPTTLQLKNASILPQLVAAGYQSITSHIDEPTDMGSFLIANPTLAQQEAAFTTIFQNQQVPATLQLVQGTLYNAVTGTAVSGGITYPYPSLQFFGKLLT